MRRVLVVYAIAASAFLGSPSWAGLAVLDQYQTDVNYMYSIGAPPMMAQTFTAGMTGILDHIEIGNLTGSGFSPAFEPVVQIRGSEPGSATLGSVTLSNPLLIDDWTSPIDFLSQGISVTAGQMYSIVLQVDTSGTASVGATEEDSYAAGALWALGIGGPGTWGLVADTYGPADMQFRTYVQAVPLPAGVWLGIFAVSVAGWHLKRRRA